MPAGERTFVKSVRNKFTYKKSPWTPENFSELPKIQGPPCPNTESLSNHLFRGHRITREHKAGNKPLVGVPDQVTNRVPAISAV